MPSKMMRAFVFGAAAANAQETGKFMSKFMPAGQMAPRPVAQESSIAQADPSILKTLADMEDQSQAMQAEYQRLAASIQNMPQADDQSASSFGWLTGFVASVGLAAGVGVAAVKKYGQQGAESMGSQISLVPQRAGDVRMFSEGDIGVLPPLGVFDPLGLIETRDMRRYEIMEIKHGRAAMLGFLHVIAIEAGIRVPGYLSTSQNLKFSDVPAGCFASLEAVPTAGWLQIMVLTCMQEAGTGFASKPQTDDAEAGDIALDSWVRYDDPEVRTFKLNVERQNGRAAMLGITGCLVHELLGVDALYPTGGLGGAAPPTIF